MRRRWTAAELDVLRARYPHEACRPIAEALGRTERTVYAMAIGLGLRKTPKRLDEAGRFLRGHRSSPATEFKPGHVTWNKGTHYVAGGRSAETRFQKGHRSKRWDPELYCVGALRINADGALDMKVHDGYRPWVPLARWTWEQAHGPIPRGYSVRARNGDPYDCQIENLYLCDRATLMRENTLHNYPKPIAQAIQLRGALMRQINKRERDGQANR